MKFLGRKMISFFFPSIENEKKNVLKKCGKIWLIGFGKGKILVGLQAIIRFVQGKVKERFFSCLQKKLYTLSEMGTSFICKSCYFFHRYRIFGRKLEEMDLNMKLLKTGTQLVSFHWTFRSKIIITFFTAYLRNYCQSHFETSFGFLIFSSDL